MLLMGKNDYNPRLDHLPVPLNLGSESSQRSNDCNVQPPESSSQTQNQHDSQDQQHASNLSHGYAQSQRFATSSRDAVLRSIFKVYKQIFGIMWNKVYIFLPTRIESRGCSSRSLGVQFSDCQRSPEGRVCSKLPRFHFTQFTCSSRYSACRDFQPIFGCAKV